LSEGGVGEMPAEKGDLAAINKTLDRGNQGAGKVGGNNAEMDRNQEKKPG